MKDILEDIDRVDVESTFSVTSLGVTDSTSEKIAEAVISLESESQGTSEVAVLDADSENNFKQKKNKKDSPQLSRKKYIRAKVLKTIAFVLPLVLCVISFFDYHIYYSFAKTEGRLATIEEFGSFYVEHYDSPLFNYVLESSVSISRYIQPAWHAVLWVIVTLASLVMCAIFLRELYKKERYYAKVEPTSNEYKKYEQSQLVRRMFKRRAILIVFLLVLLCSLFFVNYVAQGVEDVKFFDAGLDAFPNASSFDYDQIYYIEEYGEPQPFDMNLAYDIYNSFSLWQRILVKNTDKYLAVVPGYNLYRVDLIRNIEQPTSAAIDYLNCSNEQKALFTSEEREHYEYVAEAVEIDKKISLIELSALDFGWKYNEIKSRFENLPVRYKEYVYKADYLSKIPEILSQSERLKFKRYEDGWEVISDGMLSGEIVIPTTYKGKPVRGIAKYGFSNKKITSVVIPITVESIGVEAFSHCTYLENIELPSGLKTIGREAFRQCSLTDVVIPNNVKEIGRGAFNETDIVRLTLPDTVVCKDGDGVSHIANIFGYFSRADQVWVLTSKLREVIIKGGEEIDYSLWQCRYLQKISIPKTVKRFGDLTFLGCSNLDYVYYDGTLDDWLKFEFSRDTANPLSNGASLYVEGNLVSELVIPENVSTINNYAFNHCESITSVTIHNGVTTIGAYAFNQCSNITDVYYEGSEVEWAEISFGSYNGALMGATIHFNYIPE